MTPYLLTRKHWNPWEYVFWVSAAVLPLLLPQHALLFNQMAILALFALSLDLALGYAGIVSLGHAAFFGIGVYAAALFAKHIMPDPLVGLVFATITAGAAGAICSFTIVRGSDLTRLMVTLGIGLIAYELANKFDGLTGGADGLQGVEIAPLLGHFEFDLFGHTAFAYSYVVLLVLFICARRIVNSTFGWSIQSIRDNSLKATSIGISVTPRLIGIYTLAAAMAGAAGALLAQTSSFASLDVLDFHRSADVLLVLVIGGAGWLYGGLVGAIVLTFLHDWLSGITPQYWIFWMGVFLVTFMLIGRSRLFGWTSEIPLFWSKINQIARKVL